MTSHSDDILDCMGFRRADVLPLLAAAGVCVDGALLAPTPAPVRKDWPDWKLRLAVADYLTDTEVSAALAGVDLSTPGWLSDDEQAELSRQSRHKSFIQMTKHRIWAAARNEDRFLA